MGEFPAGRPARWDYFVSYASSDQEWAEWLAWHLESAGLRVLVRAWDAVPGTNWSRDVHDALADSERVMAVVSRASLASAENVRDWLAAAAADTTGHDRRLVLVRVDAVPLPGALSGLAPLDLFGLGALAAREHLFSQVGAVRTGRAKPRSQPRFPPAQAGAGVSSRPFVADGPPHSGARGPHLETHGLVLDPQPGWRPFRSVAELAHGSALARWSRLVWVAAVNLSQDAGLLVSGADDGRTRLWDVGDVGRPRLVSTVVDHESWVRTVTKAPGGRLLATGGADHAVVLRDLERPIATDRLARYECDGRVWATTFSPLGGQLAVATSRSLELWQLDGARRVAVITLKGHRDQIGTVAYSPDGRVVASGGADGFVGLWDTGPVSADNLSPRSPWRSLPHLAPVWAVAFAVDSAASSTSTSTSTSVTSVTSAASAASARSMLLATGSDDGSIRIWRVRPPVPGRPAGDSELLSRLAGHTGKVRTAAFAPDGKTLATGGDDAAVMLWDVSRTEQPRCGQVLVRQGRRVLAVAFAPDGDRLAVGSGDGKVRFYER